MAQQEQGVHSDSLNDGKGVVNGEEVNGSGEVHQVIQSLMRGVAGHKSVARWMSATRASGSRVARSGSMPPQKTQIVRVLVQLALTDNSSPGFTVERVAAIGFALFPGSSLFTARDEVIVIPTDRHVAAKLGNRAADSLLAKGLITRVRHKGVYLYMPTVAGVSLATKDGWKPVTLPALRRLFLASQRTLSYGALIG